MPKFQEAFEANDPNLFEQALDEDHSLYSSDTQQNPLYRDSIFQGNRNAIFYLILNHPNPIPFFEILFEKNPSLLSKILSDGNTVLTLAIAGKNKDLANYFIKIAPSINFLNQKDTDPRNNNSPLILALKTDTTDIALSLINKGVDVNEPEKNGLTPLHWACMMHQDQVIEALLEHGADKTKPNHFGIPPIDYYQHQMSKDDFQGRVVLKNNKVMISETFDASFNIIFIIRKNNYFPSQYPEFEEMSAHIEYPVLYNRTADPNLIQKLSIPGHSNQLEARLNNIDSEIQTAIRNWEQHGIGLHFCANDKIRNVIHVITAQINNLDDQGRYDEAALIEGQLKERTIFLDIEAGESFDAVLYDFVKNHGDKMSDISFLKELNTFCEAEYQDKVKEEIDKIEASPQPKPSSSQL